MTTKTKLPPTVEKYARAMCDAVRPLLSNSAIDVEPYNHAEFRLMNIQEAIAKLQSVERHLISHIEAQRAVDQMRRG